MGSCSGTRYSNTDEFPKVCFIWSSIKQCAGYPRLRTAWAAKKPISIVLLLLSECEDHAWMSFSPHEKQRFTGTGYNQIHGEKRHIGATQSLNKKEKKRKKRKRKEKEQPQKKQISKSFGSTTGKNLQLEEAFVLILKHGISVISKLQLWMTGVCLLCIWVIKGSTQVVSSKRGGQSGPRVTEFRSLTVLPRFKMTDFAASRQIISSRPKIVPGLLCDQWLFVAWVAEWEGQVTK